MGNASGRSGTNQGIKRRLEPRFSSGYIHVPHLRAKLEWLCGYHPRVKRHYEVAKELMVPASTLTQWLTGTQYEDDQLIAPLNPESIPIRHYPSFLDIWALPAAVIEMDDLTEFRNALATFEAGLSPWVKLVQALPDEERIEIASASRTRGLIDPDDIEDPDLLRFREGDEIMISIPSVGFAHGALLIQDRLSWSCLSPRTRESTTIQDPMVFPRQNPGGPKRFAKLEAIGGMYRVLAVLTNAPLPDSILEVFLARPLDNGALNSVVPALNNLMAAGICRTFCRRFLVSVGAS